VHLPNLGNSFTRDMPVNIADNWPNLTIDTADLAANSAYFDFPRTMVIKVANF
jgi:hypothetical protein